MVPRSTVCLLFLVSTLGHCQSPATATPTLRTGVRLVLEEVVVTDGRGNPVHGLKQGDFTVRENKDAQTISSFEEHTSSSQKQLHVQTLPPGVFTNIPITGGAVNVLLLDGLNTPPQAQVYLRNQLVKFLEVERPGTRTAVFTLNQRLHLLQDFTTDPALLKRVVKLQGVQFSPLLNRELNDTDAHQISETLSDLIERVGGSQGAMLERMQSGLLDMEARRSSQEVQVRARLTMDALNQVSRYLAGVPGRKNLLWFSGAFPISIQRDIQTTGNPFEGQADLSADLKRTVDLLAQNQVAVYPIDARGLETLPSQSVAENGEGGNLQRTQRTYGTRSATPRDDAFNTAQFAEHATMQDVAQGTGGEAFYNTNGLLEATQRAATDGENYYTLQYTPPANSKPGSFRNIEVKVNRSGLHLAYRRGYYTEAATGTARFGSPAAGPSSLSSSAAYFAPDASEIPLRLQPLKIASAPPEQTIGLKAAGQAEHGLYALNLQVPMDALDASPAEDGKRHVTLEFATLLYDNKGAVIASQMDKAALVLDEDRYRALAQGGVRFHHNIALPVNSKGTVRVLVHDVAANRVGSLRLSDEQIRQAGAVAPAHP